MLLPMDALKGIPATRARVYCNSETDYETAGRSSIKECLKCVRPSDPPLRKRKNIERRCVSCKVAANLCPTIA